MLFEQLIEVDATEFTIAKHRLDNENIGIQRVDCLYGFSSACNGFQ